MKIKKGDNVIVLTGKNKGVKGQVIKAFPALEQVVVEGVNIKKRHQRSNKQGGKGTIIEKPAPIHVSNVRKADK